jgi:nucleotide-binding universal stress UspA family protein
MFPIRAILYPTDLSELSQAAFEVARALAHDHRARLHVFHVMPLSIAYGEGFVLPPVPEHTIELKERMDALNPHDPAMPFTSHLTEGDAATEIIRLAKELGCDLIVMGTHGRSGLRRLLMGSVAEEVVRKAHCPVVTVKSPFTLAVEAEPARPAEPAHAS